METVRLNVGGLIIKKPKGLLSIMNYFDSLLNRWYSSDKEIDLSDRNPIAFLHIINCLESGISIKKKYQNECLFYGVPDEYFEEEVAEIEDETKPFQIKQYTPTTHFTSTNLNNGTMISQMTKDLRYFTIRETSPLDTLTKLIRGQDLNCYHPGITFTLTDRMCLGGQGFGNFFQCEFSRNSDFINRMWIKGRLPALPNNKRYIKNVGYHMFKSIYLKIGGMHIIRFDGLYMFIKNLLTGECDSNDAFSSDSVTERIKFSKMSTTFMLSIIPPILNLPLSYLVNSNVILGFDVHELDFITIDDHGLSSPPPTECIEISLQTRDWMFDDQLRRAILSDKTFYVNFNQIEKTLVPINNVYCQEIRIAEFSVNLETIIVVAQLKKDIERHNYSGFGVQQTSEGMTVAPIEKIAVLLNGHVYLDLSEEVMTYIFPKQLYNKPAPPGIYVISFTNEDQRKGLSTIRIENFTLQVHFKFKFEGTFTYYLEQSNILHYRNGLAGLQF